jgi:hypothetical protein
MKGSSEGVKGVENEAMGRGSENGKRGTRNQCRCTRRDVEQPEEVNVAL